MNQRWTIIVRIFLHNPHSLIKEIMKHHPTTRLISHTDYNLAFPYVTMFELSLKEQPIMLFRLVLYAVIA